MKSIDYLSIFLLLGSAPTWQAALDGFAAGLGSALLLLLVMTSINLVRGECSVPAKKTSNRRLRTTNAATARSEASARLPKRCQSCANPCHEW